MTRYKVGSIIWGIFATIFLITFVSTLPSKDPNGIIPVGIVFGITAFGTIYNFVKYLKTKGPEAKKMSNKNKVIIGSVVGGAVLLGSISSLPNNSGIEKKNYVADTYFNGNSDYSESTEPVESSIIESSSITESSSVTNQPGISNEEKTSSSTSGITSSSSSSSSSKQQQGRTYVLNTSTKVIHFSYCRDVKKIAMRNYSTTTDFNWAIRSGYKSCGHCHAR